MESGRLTPLAALTYLSILSARQIYARHLIKVIYSVFRSPADLFLTLALH